MNAPTSASNESKASDRLVFLCLVDDLSEGEIRPVQADGLPIIAVYRIGGRYYATDDCCTHACASLSEGYLRGDIIECPLHGGAFHVPTGSPTNLPCVVPLRTYSIRIIDNEIFAVVDN